MQRSYEFGQARFHPWVGDKYGSADGNLKLLVLGESHYRWAKRPRKLAETTRAALQQGREKGRFWRRLEALALSGNQEKGAGWDSASFYNYVQSFVGDGPRDRPTEEMWTSSDTLNGFKEVLHVCQPDRILVVGKTLWSMMAGAAHFPDAPPVRERRFPLPISFCTGLDHKSDRHAYWYPTGQTSYALCAPVFHPAFPRGFHHPSTVRTVATLMSRKWVPPTHDPGIG